MQSTAFFDQAPLRLLTATAVLLAPLASARAQAPARPAVSPSFLTSESVAAINLRPQSVLTNPALSFLPVEIVQALGEKHLGMDPVRIQRAIVVAEPPLGVTPYYALFLQADQDWDLTKFDPQLTAHTQPGEVGGKPCLVSVSPALPCFMVLKGKTLVAASEGMLKKFLDRSRPPASGVLADLVANRPAGDDLYMAIDLEKLQPLISLGMLQAQQQTPPEFQKFLQMPALMQSVELAVNPDGSRASRLTVAAADADKANQLEGLLKEGMQLAKQQMRADMEQQLAELRASDDPVEQATAAYADRMANGYTNWLEPQRVGDDFVLFDTGVDGAKAQQITTVAIIGVLVAMLLPAVQAAREAARRTQSMNNLRQLGLAWHNYHDAKRAFPAQAICDPQGKPLLSWRVAVLPYIEQGALYDQFHLDEPWDSPHNRSLIPLMPEILLDPSSSLERSEGKSTYAAVMGPQGIVDGSPTGLGLRNLTDGASNTVALVEVGDAAAPIWTKPQDWSPAAENPFAGLGGRHPGIFLAAFGDTSVQAIANDLDPTIWKSMLTINGGEVFDRNNF